MFSTMQKSHILVAAATALLGVNRATDLGFISHPSPNRSSQLPLFLFAASARRTSYASTTSSSGGPKNQRQRRKSLRRMTVSQRRRTLAA